MIDAHLEHGPNVPAVNSTIHIYPINGAVHRVVPEATTRTASVPTTATTTSGWWRSSAATTRATCST